MKKILLLSFFTLFLISCGTSRNTSRISNASNKSSKTNPSKSFSNNKNNSFQVKEIGAEASTDNAEEMLEDITNKIIDYAKTFQGTRYKFGGMTDAGMDCSGLVCIAFEKENINLPRISRDMATKGVSVKLNEIEKGDLVFFKTSRKNRINHVGLVVETVSGVIKFIHSTTSAGVIISTLDENYWKKAFVEVRRII